MINQAKSQYYTNKLASCDTKNAYRVVNSLLKPVSKQILPGVSDATDLATAFGEFFQEKVRNIRNTLNANVTTPLAAAPPTQVQRTLCTLPAVTQEEVKRYIAKSPNKSCILDPLPTWLLKEDQVLQAALPHITDTVIASFATGIMPRSLKTAVVKPLNRKSTLDPNQLNHYRPVSNLPFLGKLIEKIVCDCLVDHTDSNGLGDAFLSAYKRGHST